MSVDKLASDLERLLAAFSTVIGDSDPAVAGLLSSSKVASLSRALSSVADQMQPGGRAALGGGGERESRVAALRRSAARLGGRRWAALVSRALFNWHNWHRHEALVAALRSRYHSHVALRERHDALQRLHLSLEAESGEMRSELFRLRKYAQASGATAREAERAAAVRTLAELRPVNLSVLQRHVNIFSKLHNADELAHAQARLDEAVEHNRRVAVMKQRAVHIQAAARGRMTRERLRREAEAERLAALQYETEKAWATTLSRPAPKGRRGKVSRRRLAFDRAVATAYHGEREQHMGVDTELARCVRRRVRAAAGAAHTDVCVRVQGRGRGRRGVKGGGGGGGGKEGWAW